MNPASIVAGVLALVSLGLFVVSIRRGPPYGSTFDWITAALMGLSVAAMWVLRERADFAVYPFGLFCFVVGYYFGALATRRGLFSPRP
jgi:hypothetical protein